MGPPVSILLKGRTRAPNGFPMPRSGGAGKGEGGFAAQIGPLCDKKHGRGGSAVDKPMAAPLSARSYPVPRWRNW
ncbi:hypothetical protein SPYCA_0441 [Sphingopyxis sp. FD7]|nr:hypothetical protein SPYCA_0441 [Sphingopyxis sp. FD7]